MGFTATGTISIPTEEFWSFAFRYNPDPDDLFDAKKISVSEEEGLMYLPTFGGKAYTLELDDFWVFVRQYAPDFGTAETRFDTPHFSEHNLLIDFAANTEPPQKS